MPPAVVRRPRLLAALDRTRDVGLVLVIAPGGYGKSVLLRDWERHQSESAIVWIDANERDNDAARFWQRILEAVNLAIGPLPDAILRSIGSGRSAEIERAVDELARHLEEDAEPLVVVFDDFHLIRSPAALDSFEYFRDVAPDNVGIVLLSRQDPPLGVARLRVVDGLVEIRESDLRLTLDEVAAMAEASGISLEPKAVVHLHMASSGWAAAVHMALLSAGASEDPSQAISTLDTTNRALSDFFSEEVLSDMPAASREFLFSTSILDRVNASIASRVSMASDAADQLEELARRSILTTRVAGPGNWFQYHDLFRRLLSGLLTRTRSETDIQQLHLRAADWYAENNELEQAIPHWLAGNDIDAATEAMSTLSPLLMVDGRAATLLKLSQQIIDAVDDPSVTQLVCKAEALHALGEDPRELDRMIAYIDDYLSALAESAAADSEPHAADPRSWESPSALPWVRAVGHRRRGDVNELVSLYRPDVVPSPARAVESEIAEGLIWLERYTEAEEPLRLATDRANDNGYAPHIVHNLGLLATLLTGQGLFDQSESVSDRALALTDEYGLGLSRHTMYARLNSAWTKWYRGDTHDAESVALDIQEFVEGAADIPIAAQHADLRSSIRWSLGDRVGARSLLDRSNVTTIGRPISGYFRDRLRFASAKIDLLGGDPGGALLHLPDWRARLASGPATLTEWLVLARLSSAAHGPESLLQNSRPAAFEPEILHELAWQRLRAHALDLSGARERAVSELASSIKVAVQLSLVQPIVDEQAVLGSLLPLAVREAGVELPGFVVLEDAHTPRPIYVEALTAREQEVLEYMATHLSYPDIAAELFVSNNTVKTHARAVFRKLAVSKRADAVTRARYYGLIP